MYGFLFSPRASFLLWAHFWTLRLVLMKALDTIASAIPNQVMSSCTIALGSSGVGVAVMFDMLRMVPEPVRSPLTSRVLPPFPCPSAAPKPLGPFQLGIPVFRITFRLQSHLQNHKDAPPMPDGPAACPPKLHPARLCPRRSQQRGPDGYNLLLE